ncbi:MAG: nitroreductase family protein [Oscillospiraceae bacterium]|jgi:nitroreductase|nr:nitroreductase family protein [Oscillospiraceae bacterium]
MNTLQAISTRYSCRDFDDRMPSEADLQKIAEAGVQAPSGMNRQRWRVVVITNAALLAEMEAEGLRVMQSMPDPSLLPRTRTVGKNMRWDFFRQSRRRTQAGRTPAKDDNAEWRKKHPHKLPTVRARGNT